VVLPPERMQRFRAMGLATVGKVYDLLERLPALVPLPRIAGFTIFGVLARTAVHGNFPRRPGRAGCGRIETLAPDRMQLTTAQAITQNAIRQVPMLRRTCRGELGWRDAVDTQAPQVAIGRAPGAPCTGQST
jgi:hypothetical protein